MGANPSKRGGANMDVVNRESASPFVTKDGSEIREILAHRNSAIRNQSLAEATVFPGQTTEAHYHPKTEEIYYILGGEGEVFVGSEARRVSVGDGIAIPPGTPHQIRNRGDVELVFLCCCAPAYEHDDTVMIPSLVPESAG
jgi:mannose-6-phosphate isomerase-like protein (cupin superfamily)